ncbi:NAD-dependent epimerase/dehydratase family protein [Burkholderiaceae bacterium UC74_6]
MPSKSDVLAAGVRAVLPHLDASSLAGKRLFITGGTGFFGLWLLSTLKELGTVPTCVLSRDPEAFLTRHPQFRDQAWLSFAPGNVRDFDFPHGGFDLLIHAATETSATAHAAAGQMFDDIVQGSRRVLAFARQAGVQRVLLTSSGAVYGPQPGELTHQPDDSTLACNTLNPTSAYGEGKRVMEMLGTLSGLPCVTARCFAFSGPGLPIDDHFALGNFVRDALQAEAVTVGGDGTPLRSYLHGADLAVWLLTLLMRGEAGTAYNVGSDEAISIADLAHTIRDTLAPGKPVRVMQQAPIAGMQARQRYVPGVVRARALGLAPWTPMAQSVQDMAAYLHAEA